MLAAVADGGIEQRRLAALGQSDEACKIDDPGEGGIGSEKERVRDHARRGYEILERVEGYSGIEMRIDHEERAWRQQQGRSVWRCARSELAGKVAVRAGTVLHDDRLAKPHGQRLRNQPRNHVGGAAGGKRDQELDRPGRIGLRQRRGSERREEAGDKQAPANDHTLAQHLRLSPFQAGWTCANSLVLRASALPANASSPSKRLANGRKAARPCRLSPQHHIMQRRKRPLRGLCRRAGWRLRHNPVGGRITQGLIRRTPRDRAPRGGTKDV